MRTPSDCSCARLALLEQLPGGAKRDQAGTRPAAGAGADSIASPRVDSARAWSACVDRTLVLCETVGDDEQRAEGALWAAVAARWCRRGSNACSRSPMNSRRSTSARMASAPPLSRHDAGRGAIAPGPRARGQRRHLSQIRSRRTHLCRTQHLQDRRAGTTWPIRAPGRRTRSGCLGYPEQAARSGPGRRATWRERPDSHSIRRWPRRISPCCSRWRRRRRLRARMAEEALRAHQRVQGALLRSLGDHSGQLRGAARRSSQTTAHIAALRDAITSIQSERAPDCACRTISRLLAQVYVQAGRPDDGLLAIDEALAESTRHNERWWDAELQRLRGELTAGRRARPCATSRPRCCALIEIARSQQARSLELRAR